MFDVVSNVAMRAIPTAFLLLFAFIGTFGLFWLNSKKRKVEFAFAFGGGSHETALDRSCRNGKFNFECFGCLAGNGAFRFRV